MPTNVGRSYAVRLQVDGAGRATAVLRGIGQTGDRAFNTVRQSAARANQRMERMVNLGGRVQAALGALAGAAALAGVTRLTTSALESVNALADQADAIGLNVERLQEYRIAASAVGVDQDKLDQNLERFIRRWGQAASGVGALNFALRRLGIQVRDSDGNVRSAEDGLADIADAMAAAENESQRLALANSAFGRSGALMVNLLGEGSEALREQLRWARLYGEVIEEDVVRRAQTANTQLGLLQDTVRTAFQAGILDSSLGDLHDFEELLSGTRDTARQWGEIVGTGFRTVGEAAAWAADNIELVQTGLTALVGLRLGALFGPIGAASGAVVGALLSMTLQATNFEEAQSRANEAMRTASQTATDLRQPLADVANEYERLNRSQRAEVFAQLAQDLETQANALRTSAGVLGAAIDDARREINSRGLGTVAGPTIEESGPSDLIRGLVNIEGEVARLERTGTLSTDALDALSHQVLDLAQANPEAVETLREVQAALARLRADVEGTEERIADLERREALLRGETIELAEETDNLGTSLDDTSTAVAGLDQALATLRANHQTTLANLNAQLQALQQGGLAALEEQRRLQRQADRAREDAQRRFDQVREAADFGEEVPTNVFDAADQGNEAAQQAIRLAQERIDLQQGLSEEEAEARTRAEARAEAARLAWEAELAAMEPVEAQIARITQRHNQVIEQLRETGAAAEEIAEVERARDQAIAQARENARAREDAGGAAATESDAVANLIAEIDREREALRASEHERFINRFLRRLSTDATAGQVAQVRQHVEALWAEVQAQAANERAERARQRAQQEGERLTERLRTAEERYQEQLRRLGELRAAGTPEETIVRASAEAREQFLRDSEDWRAGVVRALEDYGREAGNWAQNLEQVTTRVFGRMEDALVEFTTTGQFEFRDMIDAMIADIARLIIRQSITAPLAGAIGGAISNIFGGLFSPVPTPAAVSAPTSLALATTSTPSVGPGLGGLFAQGAAFRDGRLIQRFAQGTVVDRPTLFPMAGRRMGLMGEAGEEGILPLARDRRGRLGVRLVRESASIFEDAPPQATAGGAPTYQIFVDARGATDPAAVEEAGFRGAQRALAEQLPGIVKTTTALAHARTVNDWQRRGGRFR